MKRSFNRNAMFDSLRKAQRQRSRLAKRGVGLSPVTIEPPAEAQETTVTWHGYDATRYAAETQAPKPRQGQLLWIDIRGLRDHARIARIASAQGLSDLAIADLFHLDQRAHSDNDGALVLTVLRMPVSGPPFKADQITLILGPDFVLSLREGPEDCLHNLRKRLVAGNGRIRGSSAYLFYALIDTIVDAYFPILERYGDLVENLVERVMTAPDADAIRDIQLLKRELLELRHALWPLREALTALQHDDTPQIDESLLPYLRDCSDHAFQLLDMVEIYRETAQGLVDLQLSTLSNRMNEVMKVLTMIATIFIPMTFIAGLYGMNFDRASPFNLPELGWRFGYFYAIMLMLGSAGTMLLIFFRLGWIGAKWRRRRAPESPKPHTPKPDTPKPEQRP
tara:strand:- start:377 stop:1558 length:1182 start_codon:yes stop_codon:yes gene_type:complete